MNHLRNLIIKGLVVLIISSSSAFAIPLAKMLLLTDGVKESFDTLCENLGVTGFARQQLERNITIAMQTLNNGKMPKNLSEMNSVLSFDAEVARLAKKDTTSELTPDEFVRIINRLNVEAELKGYKNTILGCTSCIDKSLSDLGIRSLLRKASESNSRVIEELFYPKSRLQMITSIKTMAKNNKLKIDNITKSPRGKLLAKLEKGGEMPAMDAKPFYIALRKTLKGSKKEKALGLSIRNFNTSSSKGGVTDYGNNSLWKLLVSDLSEPEMDSWITRLDGIVKETPDVKDRTPVLREWFRKKSVDNPGLKKHFEELKQRNCFGIF